mmetsp:Transcript_18921/g.26633  ORF Transcript_18921/g.26633 Transcript_18921/m.26633 type:complete len:102 (+) Transcript_18921:77-382(+)
MLSQQIILEKNFKASIKKIKKKRPVLQIKRSNEKKLNNQIKFKKKIRILLISHGYIINNEPSVRFASAFSLTEDKNFNKKAITHFQRNVIKKKFSYVMPLF